MQHTWPFVGREGELRRIGALLDDPAVCGVVIAGKAGVGKSRLSREVLRRLDTSRYLVRHAFASVAGADIPFGAFADLLPINSVPPDGRANLLRWASDELRADVGDRRLMLAVDDAHHLDNASAALVTHLIRTGGAFLLVTISNSEPIPESIAALWQEEWAARVELDPLTGSEVGDAVSGVLEGPVDERTVRRLFALSRGNAMLLRETVLAGVESGALALDRGEWCWSGELPLTARLTDLVSSRIGDLDSAARTALELTAFAEPIGLDLVTRLCGQAAVEQVEAKQLVVVEHDRRRTNLRLAHPLYGEVVRAICPTLRARRLRRQLADAVESTGARRRADTLRIALWRLESDTATDPMLLLAACRLAWAAHDVPLAIRLGRAAIDAGGGVRAAVLAGMVLNFAEQYEQAEEVLGSVEDLPMSDRELADFTAARSVNLLWNLDDHESAIRLIDAALRRITDADARRELAAYGSVSYFWCGVPAEAARRATALLDADGTKGHAMALTSFALSLTCTGPLPAAVATTSLAASRLAPWADQVPDVVAACALARCYGLLFSGRLDEADEVSFVDSDLAGWGLMFTLDELTRAHTARMRGRIAEAARRSEKALTYARGDSAVLRSACLGEVAHLAALRGDHVRAAATLREADRCARRSTRPLQYWVELARPWVAAAQSRTDEAVTLALRTASTARGEGYHSVEMLALHDVVRLGRGGTVVDRLTELAELLGGELAAVCARQAAGSSLHEVSADFERLGMLVHAAEAAAAAGEQHRAAGRQRDAKRETAHAAVLAARCDGARTPALLAVTMPGLTAREREVAQLAARGLSTSDIAEQLVVSQRTVDNHLGRVYAKLGISGRRELVQILKP